MARIEFHLDEADRLQGEARGLTLKAMRLDQVPAEFEADQLEGEH